MNKVMDWFCFYNLFSCIWNNNLLDNAIGLIKTTLDSSLKSKVPIVDYNGI